VASLPEAPQRLLRAPGEAWSITLRYCIILGGFGIPIAFAGPASLHFSEGTGVTVESERVEPFTIAWRDVTALNISGPGSVTTGGGFIGGGFGVDGALVGMGVAAVLNALTTKTNTFTFLHLESRAGEAFFHYGYAEPSALRMELSPVFVTLRQQVEQVSG
jgi:hypothetical protein